MNDLELIGRLSENDPQAFRILVEQYQDMVFRTSMGLLHDKEEAEDISQEVFIEVFKSIGYFRGESKLSTWLYRVTINKSLNELKKNQRQKTWSKLEDLIKGKKEDRRELSVPDRSGDNAGESEELGKILQQAIDELPENQRIAFVLAKYDELSYKEIAEIMNSTVSSIESLVHRAKSNLQKRLQKIYDTYY
jgi:RNA polymerase sigma factor (sigma-70 family)